MHRFIGKIIAVYKPTGPTSHDIIDELRDITGERKIGHAGTLDPLAEGVLVVGVGRAATKKLHTAAAAEKEYEAIIFLGQNSTTDDEEGQKTIVSVATPPTRLEIEKALTKFIGAIMQTPPIYSALKIKGQSAHRRTRRGEELKMEPRPVEIKSIELIKYQWPQLSLRVVTGPGVYIRALARDIGAALGVGGYLHKLARTRVGTFTTKDAVKLEKLRESDE